MQSINSDEIRIEDLETYLVGGAVRDQLLGLPVGERDYVVVGATPAVMKALRFKQVGADFPVFLHPDSGEEYALARTERKTAPGYHGFETRFSPEVTLEEDLQRRDLTINAMAMDPGGRLIDPTDGRKDLENKLLRHVSSAFVEDPVRILRVARFAARFSDLGFVVAGETTAMMSAMVRSGEVDSLVPERAWQEFQRSLAESAPDIFITVLRDCGALARLFPELDRLFGVPQRADHHPEVETGTHALLALRQASRLTPDPVVRFAALVHDLGKGTTPTESLPRHHGHEGRSVKLIEALCLRLRIPKHYRNLAVAVARYRGHCHTIDELRPNTILKMLSGMDAFRRPERMDQFLLACEADYLGREGLEDRPYPQAKKLRQCWDAARQVSAKPLAEKGLSGSEIGAAIQKARTEAIRQVLGG